MAVGGGSYKVVGSRYGSYSFLTQRKGLLSPSELTKYEVFPYSGTFLGSGGPKASSIHAGWVSPASYRLVHLVVIRTQFAEACISHSR